VRRSRARRLSWHETCQCSNKKKRGLGKSTIYSRFSNVRSPHRPPQCTTSIVAFMSAPRPRSLLLQKLLQSPINYQSNTHSVSKILEKSIFSATSPPHHHHNLHLHCRPLSNCAPALPYPLQHGQLTCHRPTVLGQPSARGLGGHGTSAGRHQIDGAELVHEGIRGDDL